MTALAALLSARDRQRLAERLREMEDTGRLMREPGTLAAPDAPVPLHQAGRAPAPSPAEPPGTQGASGEPQGPRGVQ